MGSSHGGIAICQRSVQHGQQVNNCSVASDYSPEMSSDESSAGFQSGSWLLPAAGSVDLQVWYDALPYDKSSSLSHGDKLSSEMLSLMIAAEKMALRQNDRCRLR